MRNHFFVHISERSDDNQIWVGFSRWLFATDLMPWSIRADAMSCEGVFIIDADAEWWSS